MTGQEDRGGTLDFSLRVREALEEGFSTTMLRKKKDQA